MGQSHQNEVHPISWDVGWSCRDDEAVYRGQDKVLQLKKSHPESAWHCKVQLGG